MKPFSDPAVLEAAEKARLGVITMENHSILGGLGTAVAETMAEAGCGRRLVRIGLKDTYAHGASQRYLMREYGIDARALIEQVESLAGESFDISDDELGKPFVAATHSKAKAEAL